jgi:ceramide glucosyltransferase
VTVLKPLKGTRPQLYGNLATFCRQDYPVFQVVFGVDDPDDPAVAVVERLRSDFPDHDLVLSVGDLPGCNRKVANLMQMMRAARWDVLAVSDADIRVSPDYLRTQVTPLDDPGIGLTTCLYRGQGDAGLPSVLEALFIDTDFVPNLCVTNLAKTFALGASMTVRRAALDRIGGFGALVDYLADDNLLGERVAAAGWRLVLLPHVVETALDATTLGDVWRHQLRWARTYRVCQPVGWFTSIITHVTLWSVLALLATGGAAVGWVMLALAARLGGSAVIIALLGDRAAARSLWAMPLKDLANAAVWTASWFGREVRWGDRRYRLDRYGRMTTASSGSRAHR